ncbi:MAG TPA: STAS domain-containing protein, partial [Mycobacterium sp.]|nr:STAS domain-containing protein [Mycobacterium sp.]
MPTSLTLDTARGDDGRLVLTAAGEIDLSNIDTFSEVLGKAITETAGPGGTLTVDLSAVEYLDSAAINALFTHAERIHVIAEPRLIRVFTISGLAELTTMEQAPPRA